MSRHLKTWFVVVAAMWCLPSAFGFALLGPFQPWQVPGLGYNALNTDIGGPQTPLEAYRWNVPEITYAFDQSFIDYFGSPGMAAIDDAFRILNELPPATQINLEDYPLDTKRDNSLAATLGLIDLKSFALSFILEELGLAEAERFAWTIRGRNTFTVGGQTFTNYSVIHMNYDPETLRPTPIVNGIRYGYQILDPIPQPNYADALELVRISPFPNIPFSSVAGGPRAGVFATTTTGQGFFGGGLGIGQFYFGLTRDDVGGLKFLYGTNNVAAEGLLATVTSRGAATASTSFGWTPIFGTTNVIGTNIIGATNIVSTNFVTTGLRGGVNKIKFTRVDFDSLIGQGFQAFTNRYTDRVVANRRLVRQAVQRAIAAPDFIFVVEDLGLSVGSIPVLIGRSGTGNWINNDAINGQGNQNGPGVIPGPARISFTNLLPFQYNQGPGFLDDLTSLGGGFVWGSFNETEATPVIYPIYESITVDQLLGRFGQ